MNVIPHSQGDDSPRPILAGMKGFTLIEVIIVVALMAVIVSLSAPSLNSAMQAMHLTNAGNKVTQLIEAARQRAMSANVQTALILITGMTDANASQTGGRAFTIVERGSGGSWEKIREWEVLPDGIVVDLDAAAGEASFMRQSPQGLPGAAPAPEHLGNSSYTYALRVFLPSGGLLNPDEPARFQLVHGIVMGQRVNYTHRDKDGGPASYYRISLLGATGKTKVDRP